MPRIYFSGRKKIPRDRVEIKLMPGRPTRFTAEINLGRAARSLPKDSKIVVEAYNNFMVQRFDFGTVGNVGTSNPLILSSFDESTAPLFRLRVVDVSRDRGAILASCERITPASPEDPAEGGKSMLKLYPLPNAQMRGELWRLEETGGGYQICYNKDVPEIREQIKDVRSKFTASILPAALRQILQRQLLWNDPDGVEEWVSFGVSLIGDLPPSSIENDCPRSEIESWIDSVLEEFSARRARFADYLIEMEEAAP